MQRRRCNLSSPGGHLISQISLLPRHDLNRISVISLMPSKHVSCDTCAIVSLPSMILSSLLYLINSLCHAYCEDMLVHVHGGALSYHYMYFDRRTPAGTLTRRICTKQAKCLHSTVGLRQKRHPHLHYTDSLCPNTCAAYFVINL